MTIRPVAVRVPSPGCAPAHSRLLAAIAATALAAAMAGPAAVMPADEGEGLPDGPELRVVVDDRVELICTIFRLAGFREYGLGRIPRYNEAVDEGFADLREHPVIAHSQELRRTRGVSYDAGMSMAVHMPLLEDLLDRQELPSFDPYPQALDARWGEEGARRFVELARDFAEEGDFVLFLEDQRELHDLGLSSDSEIEQIGAAIWSGNFYASYDRQDADLPITGDYFSLNHGVRRAGEGMSCEDCHKADSPIDFASIGYTPSEQAYYEAFLTQMPAVMATSDRTSYQSHQTISLKFACYNHGEGLTADVYYAIQVPGGALLYYPGLGTEPYPAATLYFASGFKMSEFEVPGLSFPAGAVASGSYNVYAAAVAPGTQFEILGHLSVCSFEVN